MAGGAVRRNGRRLRRAHIVLALIPLALWGAGCGRFTNGRPENCILIIVDTLRPDHLGCYGYKAIKTPNIDRLADEGIRFDQAISHVPLTLPSISSILTSLTPAEHGVHYNEGYRLPGDVTTLAEVFAGAGYRTAGFVSAVVLDSVFGIAQGFEHYDCRLPDRFPLHQASLQPLEGVFNGTQRRAEDVTDAALKWIEDNGDKPFFVLVHYFDPHVPYDPPPPFAPEVPAGRYEDILDRQVDYYDGEIAYTDSQIGRFIEGLKDMGVEGRTLIVLTADHGEGLGDKGEDTHSVFLYESTVRVPLILSGASGLSPGKVVRDQVRLIDIYPTILDVMAIEPPAGISGVSLVPLIKNGAEDVERPVYLETYANRLERGWSILKGVRMGGWKYIRAPEPELYNLRDDPGEENNLYDKESDRAARMEEVLRDWENKRAVRERIEPRITDKSILERIRSLGYVGAGGAGPDFKEPGASGPDPKEVFPAYKKKRYSDEYVRLALIYMASGRLGGSRFFLDKAVNLTPNEVMPHLYLAEVCRRQGLNEKGLDEVGKVLEQDPDNVEALYTRGLLASQAKEDDLALRSFKQAIERKPDYAQAYNNMGMIYGRRKEYDRAAPLFKKALEINPDLAQAHMNLGNVCSVQGKHVDAAREWETALKLDPGMNILHLYLGNAYFRQNRYQDALDHYESFLATHPDSSTVRQVQGWMNTIREKMGEGSSAVGR